VKRIKNSVIYYVVAGLVGLLRHVPARFVCAAGPLLGRLAWLLGRRERARALENLAAACPELPPRERRALVRHMFVNLGRSATECLALPHLLDRGGVRFAPGALQALEDALAPGRGVIFVTAHLGNWELMAAAVARVAPVAVLFKPSYDPRFTRMIDRFRRQSGVQGIDVTEIGHLRQAMACLRRGAVLGVLMDQVVPHGLGVPFLGRPARTTRLPAVLAERTGASLVLGHALREGGAGAPGACQHAIFVEPVEMNRTGAGRDATIRALVERVERAIRRDPAQWVWSLDCWRGSPLINSRPLSRGCASCIPSRNI
jgi:Kdo2-lipid IVA lauroyltransferase/acyltransferase